MKVKKVLTAVGTGTLILGTYGVAFAEGETQGIDFASALAPVQTTVMDAITAAVAVGGVIFATVFGIRKLVSVVKAMSGR